MGSTDTTSFMAPGPSDPWFSAASLQIKSDSSSQQSSLSLGPAFPGYHLLASPLHTPSPLCHPLHILPPTCFPSLHTLPSSLPLSQPKTSRHSPMGISLGHPVAPTAHPVWTQVSSTTSCIFGLTVHLWAPIAPCARAAFSQACPEVPRPRGSGKAHSCPPTPPQLSSLLTVLSYLL